MLVLDTHALVWWTLSPSHLSARARQAISHADTLGVPAIVFWEVSVLVRRNKLTLDIPVSEWASAVCRITRLRELPLTRDIALRADTLDMHSDPADRFIAATALEHAARLLTKDRLLRSLPWLPTRW